MPTPRACTAIFRRRLTACLLASAALAAAGGCGGAAVEPPPPIPPYRGYFETKRDEGIYLFETLAAKKHFDEQLNQSGLDFEAFIDRTGRRVFINTEPGAEDISAADARELAGSPTVREDATVTYTRAQQIARGFEVSQDTELFGFDDPDSPPDRQTGEADALDDAAGVSGARRRPASR